MSQRVCVARNKISKGKSKSTSTVVKSPEKVPSFGKGIFKRMGMQRLVRSQLPAFVDTYRQSCLLCKEDASGTGTEDNLGTQRLREFVRKCLIPTRNIDAMEDFDLVKEAAREGTKSSLFCLVCLKKVSKLLELYARVLDLQRDLNRERSRLLQDVLRNFPHGPMNPDEIMHYWNEEIGLEFLECAEQEIRQADLMLDFIKEEIVDYQEDFEALIVPEVSKKHELSVPVLNPTVLLERMDFSKYELKHKDGMKKSRQKKKTVQVFKEEDNESSLPSSAASHNYKAEEDFGQDFEDANEHIENDEDDYIPPSKIKRISINSRMRTRRRAAAESIQTIRDSEDYTDEHQEENNSSSSEISITLNKPKRLRKPGSSARKNKKSQSKAKPPKTQNRKLVLAASTSSPSKIAEPKSKKKCNICSKLVTPAYYRYHMRIHTGEKPLKCSHCDQHFRKHSTLARHVLCIHTKEKPHKCNLCEMAFSIKNTLRYHLAARHKVFDEMAIQCDLCPKKFARASFLKSHVDRAHNPDNENKNGNRKPKIHQREINCTLCGLTFGSNEFRSHNATEHGASQNEWPCSHCNEVFPDTSSLKIHSRRTHPSSTKFVCEVCGQASANITRFNNHAKTHEDEKPEKCPLCGKSFKQAASLRRHLAEHAGRLTHICEVCAKSFKQLRSFRKHIAIEHPDKDKPFVCKDVCFRNFATEEQLAKHLECHSNLKCQHCGRYFRTTARLNTHEFIHTGEKPFKCDLCEKGFTSNTNLLEHKYRHTGERPFKCADCDLGFIRNNKYRFHMEMVHNVQLERDSVTATRKDAGSTSN